MAYPPRKDVTDAELTVLETLWQQGPSTIRQLTQRLYPHCGPSLYATVQKLLDRLQEKGYVERAPQGRANVFSPRVGRSQLIARRLQDTADRLCGGSLTPLLTQLVSGADLTAEEIAALRRVIDRHGSGGDPR